MSDYYRLDLRCNISADAPRALHHALLWLAKGKFPDAAQIGDLPGIVQYYLQSEGSPGDGVTLYHLNDTHESVRGGMPDSYTLHLTRSFHDDEYFNGGEYFPIWLLQYVVGNGMVGTLSEINGGDSFTLWTKQDDEIIETQLNSQAGKAAPSSELGPSDAFPNIYSQKTHRFNIAKTLEQLCVFKDGFSYE